MKNASNKEFMSSPFVKLLIEFRQNKFLLDVGCEETSGSESKPDECEINCNEL